MREIDFPVEGEASPITWRPFWKQPVFVEWVIPLLQGVGLVGVGWAIYFLLF